MKKTIVAAAVAAVFAAPAMADVKISGNVIAEFVEDEMRTNNDLTVKATEDLGNGMKASAKYALQHDDGGSNTSDMSVTLSGDFGSITMGEQENFQEGTFDSFVEIDAAHDASMEGSAWDNGVTSTSRQAQLKYVSPSMSGFSLGVTAAPRGNDKTADTEVMVKFSNAGLTVMAGAGELDGGNKFDNLVATYKMGDLELRAGYRSADRAAVAVGSLSTPTTRVATAADVTASLAVDADASTIAAAGGEAVTSAIDTSANDGTHVGDGAAVAAGDILTIVTRTAPVTAAELDSTFVGAKYTMGANVIGLGFVSSDTEDQSIFSLQHKLSKNTSVYAVQKNVDGGDNQTVIGLAQKF